MINRKTSILLVLFIVLLIVFDALQQKYYIDTFDLSNGVQITLGALLRNHLIRWIIWALISIPFALIIWNKFTKPNEELSSTDWIKILGTTFISCLLAIAIVSGSGMVMENISLSFDEFQGFFVFFIFQKGLVFFMAFLALTLILFNQSKKQMIDEQSIVIENLQKMSSELELALKTTLEEEPHLNVKTGYKMKPIPLSDIIWIQADDYCVKIHTAEKAFTLRQSLKVLEQKLATHHFIRIHRGALLNLNYLDQVNFDNSTIQLTDTSELPLSKSGIQTLKKRLKQSAI